MVDSDKNFNIMYGSGEVVSGTVAFETITVGEMTVTKQEMGVVTSASFLGDTVSSGVIGLAYPGLTAIFNGTNTSADGLSNKANYNPL